MICSMRASQASHLFWNYTPINEIPFFRQLSNDSYVHLQRLHTENLVESAPVSARPPPKFISYPTAPVNRAHF
jgi:hypothetical protein